MKLILYVLGIIVVCFACSEDKGEERTMGEIIGSVSDKSTGEPIAVAHVSLSPGGYAAITGTDGTYAFTSLEEGIYKVDVNKEGYTPITTSVTVKAKEQTNAHVVMERIPAIITADCDTLDFGANEGMNTRSFKIVNSSYGNLEWNIEENCDWITRIEPVRGTLEYGKTETIVVVINRDSLVEGYNETVVVVRSASNGSSEVKVIAVGASRELATVNTLNVSNITATTATFNGEIIKIGNPPYTERGFVYHTESMPTLGNALGQMTATVTGETVYSCGVDGLVQGVTYYVRAYARNSKGIAYSTNEVRFTTMDVLPQVTTQKPTEVNIAAGTAMFHGTVVTLGEPVYTERGFVYGKMPDPTIYDNKVVSAGVGVSGAFSSEVAMLPVGHTYYVRAYAINRAGTAYGESVAVDPEWMMLTSAGLAVQKKDIGQRDWESVNAMCESSTLGGYTDWRLPSKEELMTLYTNRTVIGGFGTSNYWASSFFFDGKYIYRYFVNFKDGGQGLTGLVGNVYSARCVRTLK